LGEDGVGESEIKSEVKIEIEGEIKVKIEVKIEVEVEGEVVDRIICIFMLLAKAFNLILNLKLQKILWQT
jgi:hypothetical protein